MEIDQSQMFGALLRRHRLAAGLSQEQLAERAGLTAQAVSALERGARRTPYRDTVRALTRALSLTSEDAAVLEASVSRGRTTASQAEHPKRHVLPMPSSPLVGREREAAEVAALLHRTAADNPVRLLTLLGPGGVGKTRLALHVAQTLTAQYADGAAFVALAPLRDPALVVVAIAQALAVTEVPGRGLVEAVCRCLRNTELLLVLDNAEHVAEAAPVVTDLLAECPGLRVLVTSRARLRLSGEHVYLVPPLPLPDPDYPPAPEELAQNPAVALLLQRAQAAGAAIPLDATSAPALMTLCRQLDGLPLALELAAPRLGVFSPEMLVQRLSAPLRLLTGGPRDLPERQRTLRATLDWSYALLDPGAQAAFRRLSVVPMSCTLTAAEAVCAAGDADATISPMAGREAADWVGGLTEQSLLHREVGPEREPRFTMLETVRAYGLERLEEAGEGERVRRGHALHYLALAEEAEQGLDGPGQATWLLRLDYERDNLRAALAWALDRGVVAVAERVVAALWRYWLTRGALAEGRAWLRRVVDLPAQDGSADTAARAGALTGAAMLALEQGDGEEAGALVMEAVALARACGQDRTLVRALHVQGLVAHSAGDYTEATAQHEEALTRARTIGDRAGAASTLARLGLIASLTGDAARGTALYEESLALARDLGDTSRIAEMLVALAWQGFHRGAYDLVETQAGEGLALFRSLGNEGRGAEALWLLALVAQQQGAVDRARILHAESLGLRRMRGDELGVAQSLSALAQIALQQRDLPEARNLLTDVLSMLGEHTAPWPRAIALTLLGQVELAAGNLGMVQGLLDAGLRTFAAIGNWLYVPWSLDGLAGLAVVRGQPDRAARLLGTGEAWRQWLGSSLPPADRAGYADTISAARNALGDVAFTAAREEGRALTPEKSIAAALGCALDELDGIREGVPRA